MMATTLARCNTTSAIRKSSTPSAIPSFYRTGSEASGRTERHQAEHTRGIAGHLDKKALWQLALNRDTTVLALMIEAANGLLRKYRRGPVAQMSR